MLLTANNSLPDATRSQIARLGDPDVIVLGGTTAISNAVVDELGSMTTGSIRRVAGSGRYTTSVAVSSDGFAAANTVFLTTGTAFPDALSAAPAATRLGAPILLTTPACTPVEVIAEVGRLSAREVIVLGGTKAVSQAAATLTPCSVASAPVLVGTSGWPDAGSTGLRDPGVLKSSGSVSVSTNGAVVENLDIKGSINIDADNVTVRNVRVTNNGAKNLISITPGRSGILIEDVELDGRRVATHGIVHGGYTARRVNVYGVGDGLRAGSNTVIEDSWVHDLGHDGAYDSSPHLDAVQSVGGSNITIRNNRLEGPWQAQTSAIIFKADFAPIRNAVIEGNLLSGGTYSLYVLSTSKYAVGGDVSVRGNVFVRNSWKFGHLNRNAGAFSGNTFDDGTPI